MDSSYRPQTTGWVAFAAVVFIIAGVFNFIEGLVFLVEDTWAVLSPEDILVWDLTAWGWILVVTGIVQVVVAGGVLGGRTWGRALGVFIASLALLVNLIAVPVYPLWGITFMVLNFLVIFALVVHGDEVASE
jgi:hypothetical protein